MSEDRATTRPEPGDVEERTAALEVEGKRIRGVVPYNVEARLDGFTETISEGALARSDFSQLIATIDHADSGLPLARFPATIELEHRADGLHWSFEPPRSRQDVVEAVERGDIAGSSWRMRVAEDRWNGDHRTITRIGELRDITLAASQQPAYETAVEYRTQQAPPEKRQEVTEVETPTEVPAEERAAENQNQDAEDRTNGAGLKIEDRVEGVSPRGLADEFRVRGFPGETAEMTYDEFRALAWTGNINTLAPVRREGVPLPFDERWAFPVLPQVGVDSGTTAVQVMRQSARSLATAASVIRNIDAVTAKPETGSTLELITIDMRQIASICTNTPNILLEQEAFNRTIENDLRLAIAEGLDKLVLDSTAASGFQNPGTDSLVQSMRKAMTVLMNNGYSPDTLILRPADAEALDLLVTTSGTQDYVFSPGTFSPNIWNLSRRISKTVAAPIVMDSQSYGRLYTSPVSLARFEADAGTTNRSNVRLELHAAIGVERQGAAIRIAAA
jgi:phage head maturation protease